jgi:NAD+ synthase
VLGAIILNIEKEIDRILSFIQAIFQDSEAQGIIVGLSGGIDSATTAALCARAIGRQKILGVLLPCHSNTADINDAMLIIKHLGIKYDIFILDRINDLFIQNFSEKFELKILAEANLKPRLRMATQYLYANQLNYLVAGTGNKSECDIGYFTKYGDGGVDFLPISHLYKWEVRSIAASLALPKKILDRTPTTGLWIGQTDEEEISKQLGFPITYEELDQMLEQIEHNTINKSDAHFQKLVALVVKNKHKTAYPPHLTRVS